MPHDSSDIHLQFSVKYGYLKNGMFIEILKEILYFKNIITQEAYVNWHFSKQKFLDDEETAHHNLDLHPHRSLQAGIENVRLLHSQLNGLSLHIPRYLVLLGNRSHPKDAILLDFSQCHHFRDPVSKTCHHNIENTLQLKEYNDQVRDFLAQFSSTSIFQSSGDNLNTSAAKQGVHVLMEVELHSKNELEVRSQIGTKFDPLPQFDVDQKHCSVHLLRVRDYLQCHQTPENVPTCESDPQQNLKPALCDEEMCRTTAAVKRPGFVWFSFPVNLNRFSV